MRQISHKESRQKYLTNNPDEIYIYINLSLLPVCIAWIVYIVCIICVISIFCIIYTLFTSPVQERGEDEASFGNSQERFPQMDLSSIVFRQQLNNILNSFCNSFVQLVRSPYLTLYLPQNLHAKQGTKHSSSSQLVPMPICASMPKAGLMCQFGHLVFLETWKGFGVPWQMVRM